MDKTDSNNRRTKDDQRLDPNLNNKSPSNKCPTNNPINKKPRKNGAFLHHLYLLCLRWELVVFKDIAELCLLNFPSRRVRHLVDVLHIIGNPPLGNLAIEEALEFIGRDIG